MTLTTSFVSQSTLPCTVAPMMLSIQLATTATATIAPAAAPSACGEERRRTAGHSTATGPKTNNACTLSAPLRHKQSAQTGKHARAKPASHDAPG